MKRKLVFRTQLDRQGRVVIPARLRAETRLAPGSRVLLGVEAGRIVLQPADSLEQEMWAEAERARPGDATNELLAERRREAARDQGP
jgi:AbrB family looped-hinge helix DNA binding protein